MGEATLFQAVRNRSDNPQRMFVVLIAEPRGMQSRKDMQSKLIRRLTELTSSSSPSANSLLRMLAQVSSSLVGGATRNSCEVSTLGSRLGRPAEPGLTDYHRDGPTG